MGANWCAPNNTALSSKITQCCRFLGCRVLSSSSRYLKWRRGFFFLLKWRLFWVFKSFSSSLPCRSGSCGWSQVLGKLRCSTRAAWSRHFGFPLPYNEYLKLLLQLHIQFLKPVWKYSWLLEWERKTFKSSESCHRDLLLSWIPSKMAATASFLTGAFWRI